ncbi:MAG: asparagine synthase (glutamine-hydrolyzing) [Gemmatimonadetes bacterium]|nr:asparagine synthase (glutamine-hydrolyzing) [Gemmatimonadota bacterium]
MCGIAGIIETGIDRAVGARMLDALRHRGPDDAGIDATDLSLLLHVRLSVIDLSPRGRQPIVSRDGRLRLVVNGEIYNYVELRKRLEDRGCRFETNTDSEVILHLYGLEGERCVEALRGMFAFAIWDTERRALFAARDHLGQKPFYYHCDRGRLAFASEIKALLAWDPSLAELDHRALDQYLALRFIAPPLSMFRRIRKLPPGHTLTYRPGEEVEVRRYWTPTYEPKHGGSEEDLLDELEEVLTEACGAHMVSDVPVGAFLSGGLDSSLIVALVARRLGHRRLPTFTLALPHASYDEAPFAKQVAKACETDHHEGTVEPTLSLALPALVRQLDEPSDPLSAPTYQLARLASRHVKVVLGGDGGDELFGGYDRYYGNRYADAYARIPHELRRVVIGPALRLLPDGRWYKSKTHQIKWLHEASFFTRADRYANTLSYFHFNRRARVGLYGEAMRAAIDGFEAEGAVRGPFETDAALHPIDRMLSADSAIRLPDHPVMITDRMTMAHGLEARSPYMDVRLVEFAARLPVDLKIRGRDLRYLQRRLALRHLPETVVTRPKQGFSSALPYMMRDEFATLYHLFLAESRLARDDLIRQDAIDAHVGAHMGGRADHGQRLWLLLNSEVWYRMLILGESQRDIEAEIAIQSAEARVS